MNVWRDSTASRRGGAGKGKYMKIWMTGASGFLGARVREALRRSHAVEAPGSWDCEISDYAAVRRAIQEAAPQLVVHCAAMGDISRCEADPRRAMAVNVAGTRHVASLCAELGIPLIAVSSDQVYNYFTMELLDEYVSPAPTNFYGKTKVWGEEIVRDLVPRHHILRLSWQYGRREAGLPPSRDGLVEHLADCLEQGRPAFFTPGARQNITYIYDTVAVICAMAEGALPYGIYNLASENTRTEYETKAYILRELGASPKEIQRLLVAKEDAAPFDLRAAPRNLALAGYRFPSFEEGLEHCMGGKTI